MILPDSDKDLVKWTQLVIDRCRVSVGQRANEARSLRTWILTGSPDGNTAILNRLGPHIDRLSSYLYSPNDLRFHIDFTHHYDKKILDQAEVAARVLTREFDRRDIDLEWGSGVTEALSYGAAFPKLMVGHGGVRCRIVMPWQFGVYREDLDSLSEQEAVCETNLITPFDFWRRISHLPDAANMFKRALQYAKRQTANNDGEGFFHQVLIAGTPPVVQTDTPFTSNQAGGLVQVSADPGGAVLDPAVADEMITFHELYVVDDERQDYTTIQLAEPDILVAPRFRRVNMFVPEYLPYGMIQPNKLKGRFWGRSEIADLMKLQHLLRDRMEDLKKLMAMQYDRLLAFIGQTAMTDEMYDQFREVGWTNLEPGSDVKDVTPKLPDHAFDEIIEINKFFDDTAGFQNILSGQGEQGVRAGTHAETLLKTASPRLRDRALLVERQLGDFADKTYQLLATKEPKVFWTRDQKPENEFMLEQLPEDYRVGVDSHSSSPIYQDDHKELIAFLERMQVIDGRSALELLPVPHRDVLIERYQEMQQAKAKQLEELKNTDPKGYLKAIEGGKGKK